jgi:hypothetical protein
MPAMGAAEPSFQLAGPAPLFPSQPMPFAIASVYATHAGLGPQVADMGVD